MNRLRFVAILGFLGASIHCFANSPVIADLNPATGSPGTPVEIDGSGFGTATGTVKFNGQSATITSWADGVIMTTVPSGATTGYVVVTAGGVQSNSVNFVVSISSPLYSPAVAVQIAAGTGGAPEIASAGVSTQIVPGSGGEIEVASTGVAVQKLMQLNMPTNPISVGVAPGITSLSSSAAPLGASVTINGLNFNSPQGGSSVAFNGVVAAPSSWSNGSIIVPVPTGASTTGNLTVTVNSMTSNAVPFTVIPGISSLSPSSGDPGTSVVITGTNFGGSQGGGIVQFNGMQALVTSWTNTRVTAEVPNGASTGNVLVTNGSGLTSTSAGFTVTDSFAITLVSPSSGPIGTTVAITGGGFGANQGSSTVVFDEVAAAVVSWTDTQIVATVPSQTGTGPIAVTVNSSTAASPVPFVVTGTVQLTDSLGNVTSFTAAVEGGNWLPASSTGSGCSTCSEPGNVSNTYDSNGNMLTHTDELGHVTTYTYDANFNMASQSQQLDSTHTVTTTYTYNSFGEPLTVTDPLGNVTTNTYDANGNLLTVTAPAPNGNTAASVTKFTYNTLGQLTQITDPLGNPTKLTYNPVGLIATITDAQQNATTYGYDPHGNRTSVTDAANNTTTFAYDAGDRLTGITYPDQSTVGFGYDYRGRRTSVTDQNGKITSYAYDDADRLTSVTDAANNVTQYAYDTENNLLSITDANQNVTSFAYDAFRRVTKTTFPSTLKESYQYDAAGNLVLKTDRNGNAILYVYDALNRLMNKSYPDSSEVDYVYDLAGKIKQVADPTGTYAMAYDNMGRLIGTTTAYAFLPSLQFNNSYSYDANSNRTGLTLPDGSTDTYQYDTLNRLTSITDSLTGQFTFGYDGLSRRTSLTRPNGVNTSYGYDSLSHLLSVLHQNGTNTLDGATYAYDPAGNRTSKSNLLNGITEQYTYDPLYQLTQVVQGATTTESYSYDPVGNRLSSIGMSYSYNASNELTGTSVATYTYDANGNTLTKANASGTTQYTWDFENRLTSAVVPGVGTVTFKYDPFGRRIQKSGSTGITNYVYDGANAIEEVDGSVNLLAHYAQGAGIDEPLSAMRLGATGFYEADGLGSITSLSGSTGTISNSYTYDTFGNASALSGSFVNPYRYTARDYDVETGLQYLRARYYDPSAGRFLSEDPLQFDGGINLYPYVENQPTMLNDPSGMVQQTSIYTYYKIPWWDFYADSYTTPNIKWHVDCTCTGNGQYEAHIHFVMTYIIRYRQIALSHELKHINFADQFWYTKEKTKYGAFERTFGSLEECQRYGRELADPNGWFANTVQSDFRELNQQQLGIDPWFQRIVMH